MTHHNKVPDFLKMAKDLKTNASRYAATESVNFFKDSFVKQGFTDTSFTPWPVSKSPLAGNKILFKSQVLRNSIHKVEQSNNRVVIESDLEYSEIHNNGGVITVTEAMKSHFWKLYYETAGIERGSKTWGNIKTSEKRNYSSLSKHNLNVVGKARFFKALALMKVGSKIKIPQRQFMGESKVLMTQFDKWFEGNIDLVFKQNLNSK